MDDRLTRQAYEQARRQKQSQRQDSWGKTLLGFVVLLMGTVASTIILGLVLALLWNAFCFGWSQIP